ncbi:MAG: glycerophosphodiester phosphodiesterase [Chitinophagaceae bacterium]|nr:glycerophosphodiester phosphodiesterase [Chitinophagaceae bacterium]
MKFICLYFILFTTIVATAQPPLIHAHNDYEKPLPFTHAIQHRVFSLEADVYLIGDSLRVAHDAGKAATAPTLNALYLQPIIALFAANNGSISPDTGYSPILMIDIKKEGEVVLAVLQKQLAAYPVVFDRSVNARAVQILISGDRGPIENWKNYPPYILFDGRPYENYDSLSLGKVGFISDAYYNYVLGAGNMATRILQVAARAHSQGKTTQALGYTG